jgi:hypothetical protein
MGQCPSFLEIVSCVSGCVCGCVWLLCFVYGMYSTMPNRCKFLFLFLFSPSEMLFATTHA